MTDISDHKNVPEIPEFTEEMWAKARVSTSTAGPVLTPISDRLLSDTAYIALGRLLSSFNCLEHELMRAVISLRGGLDAIPPDTDAERQIEAEIGGNLKKRLETFIKTYRTEIGDDEWIVDFETNLIEACAYRNHFFHGLWREKEKGWLHCTFYKREAKGRKPREMVWTAKHEALLEIAEANLRNALLLKDNFISASDQAAE